MIGQERGADVPEPWTDLETVGLRIALQELGLFELYDRAVDRRPWKAEAAGDVDDPPGRRRKVLQHGESPRPAA